MPCIASISAPMLSSYPETTLVNTLWNVLKQGIGNITESIPRKMSFTRFSPPWMNSNIKRLARRKKRAYNKAKSMADIEVQVGEVAKLLKNINPHKAVGLDNISAKYLKETAAELAPALSLIIQASLQQSALPDYWKGAFVSPIFKKGDSTKPANYRPVSLTYICCKLVESRATSILTTY